MNIQQQKTVTHTHMHTHTLILTHTHLDTYKQMYIVNFLCELYGTEQKCCTYKTICLLLDYQQYRLQAGAHFIRNGIVNLYCILVGKWMLHKSGYH